MKQTSDETRLVLSRRPQTWIFPNTLFFPQFKNETRPNANLVLNQFWRGRGTWLLSGEPPKDIPTWTEAQKTSIASVAFSSSHTCNISGFLKVKLSSTVYINSLFLEDTWFIGEINIDGNSLKSLFKKAKQRESNPQWHTQMKNNYWISTEDPTAFAKLLIYTSIHNPRRDSSWLQHCHKVSH